MAFNFYTEQVTKATQGFLSFKMGTDFFAIRVKQVLEILNIPKITPVPNTPAFMKGVFNLRGNVLPLIDTRVKFGMSPAEISSESCVLVLIVPTEEGNVTVGALVDAVSEVLDLTDEQLSPSPTIGIAYNSAYINCMIQHKEQFMMLLNIGQVFSLKDSEILAESELKNET
jgi:purine-binding chemotaxis protein CheW